MRKVGLGQGPGNAPVRAFPMSCAAACPRTHRPNGGLSPAPHAALCACSAASGPDGRHICCKPRTSMQPCLPLGLRKPQSSTDSCANNRPLSAAPAACPTPARSSRRAAPLRPPGVPPPRSHGEAALALHVHEVAVGRSYQALELVLPLLQLRRGVEQINVARQHLRMRAAAGAPSGPAGELPGRRGAWPLQPPSCNAPLAGAGPAWAAAAAPPSAAKGPEAVS